MTSKVSLVNNSSHTASSNKVASFKRFMKKFAVVFEMVQLLKVLFALLIVFCTGTVNGQAKFIYEGRIEFERRINVHRQVDDEEIGSDWYKDFVKAQPPFHVSNFTLQFKDDKTIYKLNGELPTFNMWWILGPSKQNTVFTDFGTASRKSFKNVFEQNFLVSDSSVGAIEWKIGDEIRPIAGFDCRKAVGRICDSVYVVAFYTDEIPVSGGPESFNGLPGMILGIAIPRLSTTWFATKVQLSPPVPKDFEVGNKGTKTNQAKLANTLKTSSLQQWGKYGQRNMWWVLL